MPTGPSNNTATEELFNEAGKKVIVDKSSKDKWLKKGYAPKGEKPEEVKEEEEVKDSDEGIDIAELDEAGLKELIAEQELDIDLEDYDTLEEKRQAVFEAASEEDED